MSIEQRNQQPSAWREIEEHVHDTMWVYNQTITGGELPRVDSGFHDAVNSSVMGIACELARLEGETPGSDDSEGFISHLMASYVPPAVVLRWVCLALATNVPKEIDEAARRFAERDPEAIEDRGFDLFSRETAKVLKQMTVALETARKRGYDLGRAVARLEPDAA